MTAPWILAVDLGTGGPKTGAVSLDGELLAVAHRGVRDGVQRRRRRRTGPARVVAGHSRRRRGGARQAGCEPHGAIGVGITGQWGSTVPVDAGGEPVAPCLLWADTRGGPLSARRMGGPISIVGYSPGNLMRWLRLTGGAPSPHGADPLGHHLHLREREAGALCPHRDAARATRLSRHALHRPARGDPGVDDPVLAHRQPRGGKDRLPAGAACGVPAATRRSSRSCSRPAACSATSRRHVATELGLPQRHPRGCGHSGPAHRIHRLGRGGAVRGSHDDQHDLVDRVRGALQAHRRVPPDRVGPGVAHRRRISSPTTTRPRGSACSGCATRSGAGERHRKHRDADYARLTALAATAPPGAGGVLFTPWLNGERSPVEDRNLRAAFLNISMTTERAHLVRAVLEGVAFNARWLLDAVERFIEAAHAGAAHSRRRCGVGPLVPDPRGHPRPAHRAGRRSDVREPARCRVLRGDVAWQDRACRCRRRACASRGTFEPDPAARRSTSRCTAEYRRLYHRLHGVYARLNG